jgi:Zn-finger nucleic acid-binding protein
VVLCPQCELPMRPVTARANPGSLIELDQCLHCGGIWCDKWELFPIQADEAARLEAADQELLRAPVPLMRKELFCPRCTARMTAVNELAVGADVQFQRCLKCEAIWLNRGQFTRYKRHQKRLRNKKMGAEANAGRLLEPAPDTKSWVVTGTKGMFAYPAGQETVEIGHDSWSGAAALILERLLRMVSRS